MSALVQMSPVSSGHVVLIQVKVLIIHYLSIHVHPARYVVSCHVLLSRVMASQGFNHSLFINSRPPGALCRVASWRVMSGSVPSR